MSPKKMGALKGCRGHMEGLKGLGKILKSLQKQYGHAEQPSQDTQSSKYKSYNKKPIVKYIHNKCFLLLK